MASNVTNYICPSCGGPLHYSGTEEKLVCDFCDSRFEVAEIEAMMQEKNEKAAQAEGDNSWMNTGDESDGVKGMKSYVCPSCGAELICDETTAATCCPYCGNQTVIPGQFNGEFKPDYVIPFKTDKKQAIEALKNHYKGKTLLPNSFVSGNHIEDIQGVYVPFWMYDCIVRGEIDYDASNTTIRRSGDEEITTTKYYLARRGGSVPFEKVPVDASTRMPDGHMDSIEPFNYDELKEFSISYMPGFLADKYDEDADACSPRMQERVESTFISEMNGTVSQYDRHSIKEKDIRIKKEAAHYAMLPVWLLATKWNNENFLFAMNGQTGKLVGDLPMDKGKFWGFFGGISVAAIAIMSLLNFLVFDEPLAGIEFFLVCIGIPLIIAAIVCSVLKAQLKSVGRQTASRYVSGGGLDLTRREDIYLRTTTQRRKIENNNNRK